MTLRSRHRFAPFGVWFDDGDPDTSGDYSDTTGYGAGSSDNNAGTQSDWGTQDDQAAQQAAGSYGYDPNQGWNYGSQQYSDPNQGQAYGGGGNSGQQMYAGAGTSGYAWVSGSDGQGQYQWVGADPSPGFYPGQGPEQNLTGTSEGWTGTRETYPGHDALQGGPYSAPSQQVYGPGYEWDSWNGGWVPAGGWDDGGSSGGVPLPQTQYGYSQLQRRQAELQQAVNDPGMRYAAPYSGPKPVGGSPGYLPDANMQDSQGIYHGAMIPANDSTGTNATPTDDPLAPVIAALERGQANGAVSPQDAMAYLQYARDEYTNNGGDPWTLASQVDQTPAAGGSGTPPATAAPQVPPLPAGPFTYEGHPLPAGGTGGVFMPPQTPQGPLAPLNGVGIPDSGNLAYQHVLQPTQGPIPSHPDAPGSSGVQGISANDARTIQDTILDQKKYQLDADKAILDARVKNHDMAAADALAQWNQHIQTVQHELAVQTQQALVDYQNKSLAISQRSQDLQQQNQQNQLAVNTAQIAANLRGPANAFRYAKFVNQLRGQGIGGLMAQVLGPYLGSQGSPTASLTGLVGDAQNGQDVGNAQGATGDPWQGLTPITQIDPLQWRAETPDQQQLTMAQYEDVLGISPADFQAMLKGGMPSYNGPRTGQIGMFGRRQSGFARAGVL